MIEEGHFHELSQIVNIVNRGLPASFFLLLVFSQLIPSLLVSSFKWIGGLGVTDSDFDFLATSMGDEEKAKKAIEKPKKKKSKMQTFLFSATLTLGEIYKKQVSGKLKRKQSGTLQDLMSKMPFGESGPTLVNISPNQVFVLSFLIFLEHFL